jgi:hypothetical protein
MKRISLYFLFALLIACSSNKKEEALTDTVRVDAMKESLTEEEDTVTTASEDGCVFNNDYHSLTTYWLKELNESHFTWRPDLNSALIPMGQDTVSLSQGGCVHFNISVELKLTKDRHLISDSAFWMQRTLKLADDYGMDYYSKMIRAGKVRRLPEQDTDTHAWFEVDDDNEDDNLFYNGIEITFEDKGKRIQMTQYFN